MLTWLICVFLIIWSLIEWRHREKLINLEKEFILQCKTNFDKTFQINSTTQLDANELENPDNIFPFKEMKLFIQKSSEKEIDLAITPLIEYNDHSPLHTLKIVPNQTLSYALKYFIVGEDHVNKPHALIDKYVDEMVTIIRNKLPLEDSTKKNKITCVKLFISKNNGIKPLWIMEKINHFLDFFNLKYLQHRYQLLFSDNNQEYSLPLLYRYKPENNKNIIIFTGSTASLRILNNIMDKVPSNSNVFCPILPMLRCSTACKHFLKTDIIMFVRETTKILQEQFQISEIDNIIAWSFGSCFTNLFIRYSQNKLTIKKVLLLESFCSVYSYAAAYAICLKPFMSGYKFLSYLTCNENLKQKFINVYINCMLHHYRVRYCSYLYPYFRYTLLDSSILNYPHIYMLLRTNDFLSPIEKNKEFICTLTQLTKMKILMEPGEHGIKLAESLKKILEHK